jgi:hypothetical protein
MLRDIFIGTDIVGSSLTCGLVVQVQRRGASGRPTSAAGEFICRWKLAAPTKRGALPTIA